MPDAMKTLARMILRYKLLHIAYWSFAFVSFMHSRMDHFDDPWQRHIPDAIISMGTIMGCVYTIIYFLFPVFLKRGRNTAFGLFTFLAIVATAIVYALLLDVYTWLDEGKHLRNIPVLIISHLVETSVHTGLFVSVTLIYQWLENDRLRRKYEKEKLEAELNYLKAQINPHFLFNSLNSVYVLIDMDRKAAGETLLKLSDLLRYQLYECSVHSVSAARELDFLNDYISLETLRHGEYVRIQFRKPDRVDHFSLAPFLLVPFVENAFKHVSRRPDSENMICIEADVQDDAFHFSVTNSCEDDRHPLPGQGGIGLQNVRRRLELLYPSRHRLEIVQDNGIYSVNMILYADKNELPYN